MAARRATVRVAAAFVGAVTLSLVAWTFVPMSWGWQPFVVTSDSMAPAITRGDVVMIDPSARDALAAGDVFVYRRSGASPVAHRVVGRDGAGRYLAKGDANPQADPQPVAPELALGRARLLVPLIGRPALIAREHQGVAIVALAGSVGLGLIALGRRRPGRTTGVVVAAVAAAGIASTITAGSVGRPARAAFVDSTSADVTAASRGRFYPLAVLDAGPVAYWRLGDAAGDTRADLLGGAALTCTDALTGAAGALGPDADAATGLPTESAYCAAPGASDVSMTGPFTVIAWERAATWPQTPHGRIVAKHDPSAGTLGTLNYMLAWDFAGTSMRALIDTTEGRFAAIKDMPADADWHHVAMTWDGAALRLYIDGDPADGLQAPGTPRTTATAATIGHVDDDSMVGDVDEVAIFDRALSNAEIAALYALA